MTGTAINVADLFSLDERDVVRVYSGKPGCGCGCLGRYFEDRRNVRRVLSWMKREAGAAALRGERVGMKDGIAYVETSRRYLWAYVRKTEVITEYRSRDQWKAACQTMGLHTYVESTGHEGMHPDDCYATEVATKHDGETVGFGSMQPGPDGEPDGWWGVLAATGRDLAIWANEEQEPDVD